MAVVVKWRYSVRWGLKSPPPGPVELVSTVTVAGAPIPPEIAAVHVPGSGYFVTIDFDVPPGRTWSREAKARVRRQRLRRRLERRAPLFVDELESRELSARPDYFSGT